MSRKRGRPRSYDPETALSQATALFWNQGYAETSLDDLAQATGLNRPSLYGAFGDKKSLYLAALERYRQAADQAIDRIFSRDEPLREALARFYRAALDLYLAGDAGQRGCFLTGTATTEAVLDPDMRTMLRQSLSGFAGKLEARLRRAIERRELLADADPTQMARLLSAVLHSLSIRARAGETRAELEATAAAAVALICGPEQNQPAKADGA